LPDKIHAFLASQLPGTAWCEDHLNIHSQTHRKHWGVLFHTYSHGILNYPTRSCRFILLFPTYLSGSLLDFSVMR
jgi:hypothetical protein